MQKVIAVFDVGKTNKKLFLFNHDYEIVFERTARFIETTDEDGDACENLESLRLSVFDSLSEVMRKQQFELTAINFSTYGASFILVDENGIPQAPLYNYLKPYPPELKDQFYQKYGGEDNFSLASASPVLGSLNSGMQLFRIKHQQPQLWEKIAFALHLPQYMSSLLTGKMFADITSIGCHTNLWDFNNNQYHEWVKQEDVDKKLPPLFSATDTISSVFPSNRFKVGVGLHDSSAALIPYLKNFKEPFILLSTGTWCISLNPFNQHPLTSEELKKDCLCYLSYTGNAVKASRLFSGFEHELQQKKIAEAFNTNIQRFKNMKFNVKVLEKLLQPHLSLNDYINHHQEIKFPSRNWSEFSDDVTAYHQHILDLVTAQYHSTQLILANSPVSRIFVDGGFSKNLIFMNLLATAFAPIEVYASSMAQATAMGAAMAIHQAWNLGPIPNHIIELKFFAPTTLQSFN